MVQKLPGTTYQALALNRDKFGCTVRSLPME